MTKKVYIVLFGNDHYRADLHARSARHRYSRLADARQYADQYTNAYIYRLDGDGYPIPVKTRAEIRASR